jgi:hypothetical protein
MEGKRNRRVDQLIHTLVNVALPHYITNHRAQQFRFHSPNLALQKRNEINRTAESVAPEAIQEVESGRLFSVKSQSTPGLFYTVDLEAYTCRCPSFPSISFCKHICAIENNFPDLMVPRSLPIASQPWDEEDNIQAPVPTAATALPALRLVSSEDAVLLDCIAKKLQAMQRKEVSLAPSLATTLRGLDILLTEAPNGTQILPRGVNVAPNQGTRNETAEVMGVRKKGAKKRKNVEAYCGGETSGKSARADARVPKKPKITHLPESAPSFESEIPAVDQGFLDSAAAFDSVPQAPDSEETVSSETPEMLLRRTLTMYNALFPPDAPRTTLYYHNNSYPITGSSGGSYYC